MSRRKRYDDRFKAQVAIEAIKKPTDRRSDCQSLRCPPDSSQPMEKAGA